MEVFPGGGINVGDADFLAFLWLCKQTFSQSQITLHYPKLYDLYHTYIGFSKSPRHSLSEPLLQIGTQKYLIRGKTVVCPATDGSITRINNSDFYFSGPLMEVIEELSGGVAET